ncbi:beta-Ala-His dipeptidase [Cloacibacillus sp. An23]|uniref:beta-Ala-His dipeptidase n=1 Tax=Cloacibacillus sp. An23 TaxID=1965591 RepID=UPI000B3779F7|nr:beta-Ala-His dipeptidase [Cloacibacillus sp. An23]OUO94600.1 aminoacyl-histidine dipeptidase [Cloacibacillus sp. An23]
MDKKLEELIHEPVFRCFYEISQIPRASFHEERISEYLLQWAEARGLSAERDGSNNVLIRKPASPGYEDAPCVMLQAHMDMVCEKALGVEHDFGRDPINMEIEGDWITTGGRTTLGADDGIGVALAMAAFEDEGLAHPELEVLFTTAEEDDMSGAENFDAAKMKAVKLINLDHTCDREIICGSCGGMQVDIRIPVIADKPPEGWAPYRLSVSGLKGGHSGEDIHRGRGSANVLLNRMLMAVQECCDFRLGPIRGGTFRLAIARDAEAVVWMPPSCLEQAHAKLQKMQELARSELAATANGVAVALEPASHAPEWAVVSPARVIDAMALCPDGIYQMNEMLVGLVDTSDNVGEIYLDEHELHFVIEIRAARESRRTYLFQRMQRLADIFGGTCHSSNAYPSWHFQPKSPLRELCVKVYEDCFGEKPEVLTVHAGLEVGYFSAKRPDIDAVSLGPECKNFHSPSEALQISSTRKMYGYLRRLLAALG